MLPGSKKPVAGIFTVDQETGVPAETYTVAFEVTDWEEDVFGSWRDVVVDDGTAYWTSVTGGSGNYTAEVCAYPLAMTPTDLPQLKEYDFQLPPGMAEMVSFSGFDADSGYVMIKPSFQGGDNSVVIILDTKTGGVQVIDTGFYIIDSQ